jgi:anti-sigma factor RsiW
VKHRHLLPNEIDLLVDGDVGFGVAPLRAHLRECAECEAKVDEAREVAMALEELPHLAPSTLFSERVMSQVQVFEPWHVAARDSLARLVPRSAPARAAAVVFGSGAAIVLASLSIWIAGRLDILAFLSGAAVQRSREVITSLVEGVIGTAFGPTALSFVRGTGSVGLIIATLALAGAAGIAVMGVRRLATASSRRAGGS